MYYVAHGSLPRQRHTQHRGPDGSLYAEELFGVEGFSGRNSILYHLVPPTQTHKIEPVRRIELVAADDGLHRHRLTKTGAVTPNGDAISGRIPLYFNNDVVFGIVRPRSNYDRDVHQMRCGFDSLQNFKPRDSWKREIQKDQIRAVHLRVGWFFVEET